MIYFESERLIFRDWKDEDLSDFRKMNADPDVMEFFFKPLSTDETDVFVLRIMDELREEGYGLYAVEVKETGGFIGFIGFHKATLHLGLDPMIEIGWRLKKEAWGHGYATEGAKRCLAYGFEKLGFTDVYSFTSVVNIRSERVMQKVGMFKVQVFDHPRIEDGHVLRPHVLYHVTED